MAFAKGFFDRQSGAADLVFTPTTSIPVSNVQDAIQYVWDNVNGGVAGTYAPPDAEYLTSSLASGLSNERVVGNGTGITWDFSGASAAVANLDHLGIEDLTDPGADRGMFWDSSASATAWFTPSGGLAFEGTNLTISDPDLAAIVSEASFALGDVLYHDGTTLARLPAGTSGQFLRTRGTAAAPDWQNIAGGGDMLRANNLSDLTDAAAARVNLGLELGVDVQAYDAELAALAGLTSAADALPYFSGAGTASTTTLTAFGRSILDDADEATFKATVNLEIGTDVQAYSANLDTWSGIAPSANVQSLVGAADYAAMRALLDLEVGTDFLSPAAIAAAYQPLDAELTSLSNASANGVSLVTAADYAAMRALLDLEVGTDFLSPAAIAAAYQPLDADLTTWAGLTPSANAQSLVTAANYAAMRTLLDLEVGTDFLSPAAIAAAYQPLDAELTAIAGLASTDSNFIVGSATGWVVESGATVRTSLGLGTMATEAAADYLTTAAAAAGYQPLDAELTSLAGASANGVSLVTAANYAAMRTLLDLEVGTDFLSPAAIAAAYQPLDGELTAIAGLTSAADRLPYFTGSGTASLATFTAFGRSILDDADEATFKATVNLEIGTDVQAYDADTLKADLADILTAGFAATPYNAGTKSSGTFTPDEANGNFQYATNGGAHTFAPPTNNGTMIVLYANDASAGAITTSGFTQVTGDSLTTTNGHEFLFYVTKHNNGTAFSHLHVTALQ